jgi:hypothetical protein
MKIKGQAKRIVRVRWTVFPFALPSKRIVNINSSGAVLMPDAGVSSAKSVQVQEYAAQKTQARTPRFHSPI